MISPGTRSPGKSYVKKLELTYIVRICILSRRFGRRDNFVAAALDNGLAYAESSAAS